ncbi:MULTISPECIES: hypothetical protein [unclassified Nocardioides]|uniref:hypothetical protein n=1 Tax=unclassified Nocardioides TaxID=2615069 RepID=UPI0006F41F75|nr:MULTISPECIES: hypothetical protein [unclassified Nocardioides]KRA38932.1 hypothetical protein ASD81_10220 [Nocardioides sp. Root614]KRA92891.1 hypothetical protein ASD84_10485 [Nocardioides sp. Root682]
MRLPLRVVSALSVVLFSLLPAAAGATPGMPDGCGELALSDRAAVHERGSTAEDVFVGRVDGVLPGVLPGGGTAGASEHRVFVQVPLKSDLPAGKYVQVTFTPTDEVPDRTLRVGVRYIFFTRGSAPAELRADACDGYVIASGLDQAGVVRLREYLAVPPAPVETPGSTLSEPPADADSTPDLGRLLAPGGAISLIGVLGLVLISRLGRQKF